MFNTPIGDWRSTPADKRQKRISLFGDIDDGFVYADKVLALEARNRSRSA